MKGGGKGVTFSSRELAGRVRDMGLKHLERILADDYEDKQFQREILVRLAANLLPRQNEVSGPNGKPIPISNVFCNNSDKEDSGPEEED